MKTFAIVLPALAALLILSCGGGILNVSAGSTGAAGGPVCIADAGCCTSAAECVNLPVFAEDECSFIDCDPTGQLTQPGSSIAGCVTAPQPAGTPCQFSGGGPGVCTGSAQHQDDNCLPIDAGADQ
jgi:hypothetical protein